MSLKEYTYCSVQEYSDFVGVNVLVNVDVGTSVSVGVKVFVGTSVFDGVLVSEGVKVLVGVSVGGRVRLAVKRPGWRPGVRGCRGNS